MFWTDLVDILAPGGRPPQSLDEAVLERVLYLSVSLVPGIVGVERGEDVERVNALDETNLAFPEMAAVDSEGLDPGSPAGNGIECSLHEHDNSSSLRGVVEEELSHIDTRGVAVTGSTTIQCAPHHTQHLSGRVSQGIGDRVVVRVVSQPEVSCRSRSHTLGPIRMQPPCVPTAEP